MNGTQQPEALRMAHALSGGKLIDDSTEWADTLHAAAAELRHKPARIEELEAQLSTSQPAAQGMDAQTIRHISALSELVRMPNAEHFADAHNAAVRHLRVIAAQVKHGEAQQ